MPEINKDCLIGGAEVHPGRLLVRVPDASCYLVMRSSHSHFFFSIARDDMCFTTRTPSSNAARAMTRRA